MRCLVGDVLCQDGYTEESMARVTNLLPIVSKKPGELDFERRCSYKFCENPCESSHFYKISEGKITGGQNWAPLVGAVLCRSCYVRYERRGSLERPSRALKVLACVAAQRKETENIGAAIARSDRLAQSRRDDQEATDTQSDSSQERDDTKELSLKLSVSTSVSAVSSRGVCTNPSCDRPMMSSHYHKIKAGTQAGGRDWSRFFGSVFCNACYHRYRHKGRIEKKGRKAFRALRKRDQNGVRTKTGLDGSQLRKRKFDERDDDVSRKCMAISALLNAEPWAEELGETTDASTTKGEDSDADDYTWNSC